MKNENSLTGRYLSGKEKINMPTKIREGNEDTDLKQVSSGWS